MKASVLINKLQKYISEHGDCNVVFVDANYYSDSDNIKIFEMAEDRDMCGIFPASKEDAS